MMIVNYDLQDKEILELKLETAAQKSNRDIKPTQRVTSVSYDDPIRGRESEIFALQKENAQLKEVNNKLEQTVATIEQVRIFSLK